MPYNSSDPSSSSSDIGAPLTGWTTNAPSPTFAPNGGIGGDWRFPSLQVDPRILPPPQQRVLRNPAPAAIQPRANLYSGPIGPTQPNINVPVGQVAGSGSGSLWDALRALFSGQPGPQAQAQGMTGMLQSRGQVGPSTDALGNPFNRFG